MKMENKIIINNLNLNSYMKKVLIVFILFISFFTISYSETFIIDNEFQNETFLFVNGTTGNVGIGNEDPQEGLYIEDEGVLLNVDSTNSTTNKIKLSDGGVIRSFLGASSSYLFSIANNLGLLKFVVTSDGKVGIGTTTPQTQVHVVGDINASGNICINGGRCLDNITPTNSIDYTSNIFSFTNTSQVPANTLKMSNSVVVNNFEVGLIALVSGLGSPQLSINSGTWSSSSLVLPGDSIRLRATSSYNSLDLREINLSVGTFSTIWNLLSGYFGGNVSSSQKISDTAGNFTETLDNTDYFGISISNIGDLDNDGVNDLIVGASRDDDGATDRGAVYILFMNTDGTVSSTQKISDTAGSFTATFYSNDQFGGAVAGIGDLDGDTVEDVAVTVSYDDDGGSNNRGALYVIFLNTDGTTSSYQKISDTAGNFTEILGTNDEMGSAMANIGDLDDDGITDLIITAHQDDDGGTDRGAAYILFMNTDGTVSSSQKISDTVGNFTEIIGDSDRMGRAVAGIGDLDGDGIEDIALGHQEEDAGGTDRGAIYILFMNTDGTVSSSQKISDIDGNFTETLEDSDNFGSSIDDLGDLNGDGIIDLAVGAYGDDDGGTSRGAVYILYMNSDGTVSFSKKISDTTGNFTETLDDVDLFGSSVSNIGDLDGDGVTDMVSGAFTDDDGSTDRGAVYVLFMDG